jgi:hypothetical protein
MIFSDDDLKSLIEYKPIASGMTDLGRVVRGLKRSHLIDVEADFDHYGSGTASYVDVFCWKRSGKSTVRKGDVDYIDGIAVYLSRLAPVAAYGPMLRTQHATGGSSSYLTAEVIGECPAGHWDEELEEIKTKLTRYYGITLLYREDLIKKLPFKAKIPTCFKKKGYQIFDAIFYYDD